ncbi:MAG TPA: alcohol dehydrogenase catalytic domain-containing protein [Clostridiaceae bacterium]|nr:alcohol dehydrogenase catalytic domain-containing protein [Clostridiaceae bacterium]
MMKALFAKGEFQFDIREMPVPSPKEGEVLVKVRACGVCGTDLHISKNWKEDYAPLGHEISGEVVEVGKGVHGYKPGDKVIVEDVAQCGVCSDCKNGATYKCRSGPTLNGQPGMSEYLCVDYRMLNHFDGIDFVNASLVEPCAVSINAVLNAKVQLGSNVVVLGHGPIGLMCVRIAKLMGAAKVALVGTSGKNKKGAARFKAGEKMGADKIIESSETDAVEAVKSYFKGGADSIIVTSPPETLPDAIKMARYGGVISIAGIDLGGRSKVEIDVNELIFNKITINSTFAEPAQSFPTSIKLIREGLLDAGSIITHTFSFEEAPEIIRKCFSGDEGIVKAVLVPSDTDKVR